jgi:outer membrane protein
MKKLLIKGILTLMLGIVTFSATAQKLAHVNRGQILQNMPEVQKAQQNLQSYSKELESQVQQLLKEYRTKLKSFEENREAMTTTQRNDKQRELKNLEERIQKFRQDAQKQVSQKRSELLKPIMEDINKAIEAVAEEKGYTYVFDASQGSILYAEEGRNITPLVKQRLDM